MRTVQHVGFGVSIRRAAGGWAVGFQNERVTRRGLAAAQALGLETTVYTVNDTARDAPSCATLGVTGVFTDDPEAALAALRLDPSPMSGMLRRRPALSSWTPSDGTCATTLRADRERRRARGRHVGDQAARCIFRRVTGPRNVCVSTSAESVFAVRAAPFAGGLQLERLRPDQDSTRSPFGRPRAASIRSRVPACSTSPAAPSTTFASSRFIVPMNSATNGVFGARVHLRRRPHLLDHAAVHDRDVVGDRERLLLVVRHVQRGDPELELDAADLLAQLHAHLRVERRQRLVEEQHARLDRERARKRDALLHAARELMRVAVARVPEADELEQVVDALASGPPCRGRGSSARTRRSGGRVMFGNSEYAWKTIPMSRLLGATPVRSLPSTRMRPDVRAVEPGDEAQRGRLAAARRAEQRQELALAERDVDAFQRLDSCRSARWRFSSWR